MLVSPRFDISETELLTELVTSDNAASVVNPSCIYVPGWLSDIASRLSVRVCGRAATYLLEHHPSVLRKVIARAMIDRPGEAEPLRVILAKIAEAESRLSDYMDEAAAGSL